LDNDIYGKDNSYDYGARFYDPRLGRFLSRDALEKKDPYISPYVYAEDKPIIAKDADGNVVIFIGGQHAGDGGSMSYWGINLALSIMDNLKDKSAIFVDGANGGWANTLTHVAAGAILGDGFGAGISVMKFSNINMGVRIAAGKAQGMKDAPNIIANLNPNGKETIKIVTHSMGTAFARGYVQGILDYAAKHGLSSKVHIEFELDINAFNSKDVPAPNKSIKFALSKTALNQGWWFLGVGTTPVGTKDISTDKDKAGTHSISTITPFIGLNNTYLPDASKGGSNNIHEEGSNNLQPLTKNTPPPK
jgi:RHS repeat-associated protein